MTMQDSTDTAQGDQRSRLLAAARGAIESSGPEVLRARAVTAAVGASTQALYTHFGGMPGLIAGVVAHSFDRFMGRDRGGPGLGLALVKALVELHGGWVALQSEPGAGATFTCHLPESAHSGAAAPELEF